MLTFGVACVLSIFSRCFWWQFPKIRCIKTMVWAWHYDHINKRNNYTSQNFQRADCHYDKL